MFPKVCDAAPQGQWMRRLRESNWIWLVKEQQYATVAFPWQPPEPGFRTGRLVLTKLIEHGGQLYRGETQVWYVGSEGEGLDGKLLVLPCEGHLPKTLAEIVDRQEVQLLSTLDHLLRQETKLNVAVISLYEESNIRNDEMHRLSESVKKLWQVVAALAANAGYDVDLGRNKPE